MKFVALGATDRIGASCHFLQINGTGLVLDAGSDPKEDGPASVPRFDLVRRRFGGYIDHAIITHVHHDHVGALPVLMQRFPHVVAHLTPATHRLAERILPASARLQRRRLKEGSSEHDPLFDEEELELYSQLYLTHELEAPFDVTGPRGTTDVAASFYDAGHILGSAGVLLTFEEGGNERRVFYTSDTRTGRQTIIPGGRYPEPSIDVLILESTQAADPEPEETTRAEEEERLGQAINDVLTGGGNVLIPAFAMGRAQEVLAPIGRYRREGLIPPETPVYTAGSMRAIADLYDKTREDTPRIDPSFRVYGVEQERLPRRERVHETLQAPAIHIASSGMMFEPTLSNWLARRLVEGEKNGIFFVGYAKEGTPAERLQAAAAEGAGTRVVLNGRDTAQPVNCRVERFRMSGHSHRRELVELAGALDPEKVLLVHGEEEARTWMAEHIAAAHPSVEVIRPQHTELLEV